MRVVNMWNGLPDAVVMSPSVNCFKGRFDRAYGDRKYQMEWEDLRGCDDTSMWDREGERD